MRPSASTTRASNTPLSIIHRSAQGSPCRTERLPGAHDDEGEWFDDAHRANDHQHHPRRTVAAAH